MPERKEARCEREGRREGSLELLPEDPEPVVWATRGVTFEMDDLRE